MKKFFCVLLVASVAVQPSTAQEDDGSSLMEEGAQQFLEGLLRQMEPALEGMSEFIEEMGPSLGELMSRIEDWSVYEAPEILDNGDIIIRRKPQEPEPDTQKPAPDMPPQIDL